MKRLLSLLCALLLLAACQPPRIEEYPLLLRYREHLYPAEAGDIWIEQEFGMFNGYRVLAMDGEWPRRLILIPEEIAGYVFTPHRSGSVHIYAYKNGVFIWLPHAYEFGHLTQDDISTIWAQAIDWH